MNKTMTITKQRDALLAALIELLNAPGEGRISASEPDSYEAVHQRCSELVANLKEEAELLLMREAYSKLQQEHDKLDEFLFDDIGDSFTQLGEKRFNQLRGEHKEQAIELSRLRDKMMQFEIESFSVA